MLTELLSIVAPVYLCAAVGFTWVRSGRSYDTAMMTDLVMLVGSPCLVFSSLVGRGIEIDTLLEMMGAVVLATSAMAGIAAVGLRLSGQPLSTFLAPMTFGNTGNMGIPICYFAFGDEGLALGVCFFAMTAFLQFTVGHFMWSGALSFRELLRMPLVWASVLAMAVVAGGFSVPNVVLRTTGLMGEFTIPIMQFTLGVSLARLELTRVGANVLLSLFKISLGASVGFAVVWLFGFEGAAAGVVILDCAMPVAVFNYMLASRFDRSPGDVASVIVLSTLLSLATIPLLLSFLLPG
jgi:predicted permease